ncbi:MAG TPA: YceI family protein [Solirubrobacteraceae bacterium]|nr:YceI family protein [Solirubrobacteraceae bacterium]
MSTATIAPTGTWTVDAAHSKVGFAVKHLGIATVRGEFTDFEGTLEIGEDLASSRAYGTVKTASIDTNEPGRDEHLRSGDFFNAETNPQIAFESTAIEQVDDGVLRVTGNLTINGITKEEVFHAAIQGTETDPWGNERVAFEVTGEISRGDYGMTFNQVLGSGNLLVGEKVKLALDISAVKAS